MKKFLNFIKRNTVLSIVLCIAILILFVLNVSDSTYYFADILNKNGYYKQQEFLLKSNLKNKECFSKVFSKRRACSIAVQKMINFYYLQKDYKSLLDLYLTYMDDNYLPYIPSRDIAVTAVVDKSNLYSDVGVIYAENNQYDKALANLQKAIDIKSSEINIEKIDYKVAYLIEDYIRLANLYLKINNYEMSKKYIDNSFSILHRLPKDFQTEKMLFLTNLTASDFYLKTKKYKLAEYHAAQMFLEVPASALPIKSYINFQSVFWIAANAQMGKVKFYEHKYEEAKTFQRKALFMTEEYYGENSPETMCSYSALLQTLKKTKNETRYINSIEHQIFNTGKKLLMFNNKNIDIDDILEFCKK